jgi:hypothetical protein
MVEKHEPAHVFIPTAMIVVLFANDNIARHAKLVFATYQRTTAVSMAHRMIVVC